MIQNVKTVLAAVVTEVRKPGFFPRAGKAIMLFPPRSARILFLFFTFFLMLLLFVIGEVFRGLSKIPVLGFGLKMLGPLWLKYGQSHYDKTMKFLDSPRAFKVKRSYLIYIGLQNLLSRKGRSMITITGMSIGVGIIVYLLSLGYGVERLIISQVASLNELQQVDVAAGETTSSKIDSRALIKLSKIQGIKKALPLISVVGRVNYQNAKTDVVVYAAPRDLLNISRFNLIRGKYYAQAFSPNNFELNGTVAGAETELKHAIKGQSITGRTILFNGIIGEQTPVWASCSIKAKLIGFTEHLEGGFEGDEVWGGEYSPFDPWGRMAYDDKREEYLGSWVEGKVPLFIEAPDKSIIPQFDDSGRQIWADGCMQRKDIQIVDNNVLKGEVLAAATSSATLDQPASNASESARLAFDSAIVSTDSAGIEVVKLTSEDTGTTSSASAAIAFQDPPSGTALISSALLKLLNIQNSQALRSSFKISFIIPRSLMPQIRSKSLTEEVSYKIAGVLDDPERQFIYIPFSDMQNLGIPYYSQVKLIVDNQKHLPSIRHQVETMGFTTTSAVDTVAQIERLFANLRIILVMIGMIALGVAALGMFNTLTVSLLERTREIGGMKTIGMVTAEIQDLFLAEAMIMGFSGGIGGLVLGFVVGKLSSFLISIVAISKGTGYLELTYIPPFLVFFILGCSFVVGLITGLYPAYRARKISALNALRYE